MILFEFAAVLLAVVQVEVAFFVTEIGIVVLLLAVAQFEIVS